MGSFLHKLWDETLAGPAPDSGLGKLRKYNSFSARSVDAPPPAVVAPMDDNSLRSPDSGSKAIARSFPRGSLSVSIDSQAAPPSPSGSSTPSTPSLPSPFSPNTPGGNFKKLTRRKSTSSALPNSESKSPTGYDWIVLSSLDR